MGLRVVLFTVAFNLLLWLSRLTLGERPIAPLTDELMAAGCTFQGATELPLRVTGRMRAGRFELPGNVSSQYSSGLLLAAPLLDGDTQIAVTGEIESRPYIGLTLAVLNAFGVKSIAVVTPLPGDPLRRACESVMSRVATPRSHDRP